MKKFNFMTILFLLGCLFCTETYAQEDNEVLRAPVFHLKDIGQGVAKISKYLDAKLDGIKLHLRNEMTSDLNKVSDDIKSQISSLSVPNGLDEKIEKIEKLSNWIVLSLEKQEKLSLSLEKLLHKIELTLGKLLPMNQTELENSQSETTAQECDWITIQRRGTPLKEGRIREPFGKRNWTEYENGFGSSDADFWLGLKQIHDITSKVPAELRIDLVDWDGNTAFASYDFFKVSGPDTKYRLAVTGYSGNAGDSLTYSSGQKFSTIDQDNDAWTTVDCVSINGPWWHKTCSWCHLNYEYQNHSKVHHRNGIIWNAWKGLEYSLKKTEMKIRPASCN